MKNKNIVSKKERKSYPFFKTFHLKIFKDSTITAREDQLLYDIKSALNEWKNAENTFEFVTSPDLIDHAIYRIEAAKLRYVHLIKLAKEQHIKGIL
ncbi:MAG: YaaL family protein [Marinisporobacter sp.]|jgi:hypothetical protein|nr:YaaL family protein [Marinisporobacter sp.]